MCLCNLVLEKDGDVLWHGKVTAGLAERNAGDDLKSPVHWDQLQTQRSVTSMGKLYFFTVTNNKKQVLSNNK